MEDGAGELEGPLPCGLSIDEGTVVHMTANELTCRRYHCPPSANIWQDGCTGAYVKWQHDRNVTFQIGCDEGSGRARLIDRQANNSYANRNLQPAN